MNPADPCTAFLDVASDFIEGRLAPARSAAIRNHLDVCAECRAQFNRVLRCRDEAGGTATPHLRPERIAALSEERLPQPDAAEDAHLATCAECSAELAWARSAPPVEEVGKSAARPRGPLLLQPLRELWETFRRRPMWGAGGLGIATAVIVFFIFFTPEDRARHFEDLALVEPLPAQFERGDDKGEFAARFMKGLELYAAGSYAQAAKEFESLVPLSADPAPVLLYLGSSQLLDGQPGEAAQTLRGAVDRAGTPRIREESSWQLAQALLLHGEGLEAGGALTKVARLGGMHALEATELLGKLAQRVGSEVPPPAAPPDSSAAR